MKSVVRATGLLLSLGLVMGCHLTPNPPPAGAPSVDQSSATVVRVVDGDTLVVMLDDVKTTVRLLNVDTPETKDPNKAVQCLGPEASEFLTDMLPAGTPVELEFDGEKLDRYGRTLAGVFLGEALVNAEIARAGFGVPVQFNGQVKFLPPVEAAAAEAQRTGAGAYADDVDCALPGQVEEALAGLEEVDDPNKQTAAAYGIVIASLAKARRAAADAERLADTAAHASGIAAWLFHDAVRSTQQTRIQGRLSRADDRLRTLRSTQKSLAKSEAVAKQREQDRGRARQERLAEREQAARAERAAEAEARARAMAQEQVAERQRQQRATQPRAVRKSPPTSSGGSNPPGYTGARCYAPGGKTWRPC